MTQRKKLSNRPRTGLSGSTMKKESTKSSARWNARKLRTELELVSIEDARLVAESMDKLLSLGMKSDNFCYAVRNFLEVGYEIGRKESKIGVYTYDDSLSR